MHGKQAKTFIITGLLAIAGVLGGLSLGSFTTGDGGARALSDTSSWPLADDRSAAPANVPHTPVDQGPIAYVCQGCGPTLAEQRAKADAARYERDAGYARSDLPPLPALHVAPDGEEGITPHGGKTEPPL